MMACQCRFTSYNKSPILVGDVDNREVARVCRYGGGMWKTPGPTIQFCYDPKTALNNVIIISKVELISSVSTLRKQVWGTGANQEGGRRE